MTPINRNLGMDLVRATEAAALSAGRWMGLGNRSEADDAAMNAMAEILNSLDIDGYIVVGEDAQIGDESPLAGGRRIGTGRGPEVDVVVDPIDGKRMLAEGRSGAISVAAVAPRGSMWAPRSARYMEKLVVNAEAGHALVPECLDAPAAWTLALVARIKKKAVRDLVVFVLDRPRHQDLINEIRAAGARVMLRGDGDVAGALMAASRRSPVDVLMGIGGVSEGIMSACAVTSLGGAMLARLAPQSDAEHAAVIANGHDLKQILSLHELVASNQIFFSATGIADGPLLSGVRYAGDRAETHSLVLRAETGTRRIIQAEHLLSEE
ncbi:MAG: class II fructose-bisphosphatase [Roseiflexaceae bacterium]|nr:class II fructose-bisphosphatase [Roseiflexaceae bacterium]